MHLLFNWSTEFNQITHSILNKPLAVVEYDIYMCIRKFNFVFKGEIILLFYSDHIPAQSNYLVGAPPFKLKQEFKSKLCVHKSITRWPSLKLLKDCYKIHIVLE